MKMILLVGVVYAVGNIMYFGIQFTFEDQGFNYGINSIIIGGVEMVSFAFLRIISLIYLDFFITKISRTKGISLFYALTAIVGLLFMIPAVQSSQIISASLIGVSRIFFSTYLFNLIAVGYTLIVCLQTESFSVEIQSTAAGVIEAISLLGVIVAPGIVSLSLMMQWNPLVVLSLLLILGIVPNFFITESQECEGFLFRYMGGGIDGEEDTESAVEMVSIASSLQSREWEDPQTKVKLLPI